MRRLVQQNGENHMHPKILIAGLGVFLAAGLATDPASPAPRPSPSPTDGRVRVCEPFGNLAATAFTIAESGLPAEAAIATASAQVSEQHIARMVRSAVLIGYGASSADLARRRVLALCASGNLGAAR